MLLAAGQLVGAVVRARLEADRAQELSRFVDRVLLAPTQQRQRQPHVLERGQQRQQPRGLECPADRSLAEPVELAAAQRADVEPADAYFTRIRPVQSAEQAEQRAL